MKVIVTGGRNYTKREHVFCTLDAIHAETPIACVVQGGASGADGLARQWAGSRNVACETNPADWRTHGRAAGPIRNGNMLKDHPDAIVVAFAGGRGTADMVRQAEKAGVEVFHAE